MDSSNSMRKRPSLLSTMGWSVCGLFLSCSIAQAYLDLGTGSFILQIVLAAMAAWVLAIGNFWQQIKLTFKKFTPGSSKDPDGDDTVPNEQD